MREDRWRIYFATRSRRNQSSIYAVDVDPLDDMRVIDRHERPLLAPATAGHFDVAGTGPGCALRVGERVLLYYVGICRRADVPHQHAIGVAISDDGLEFERAFEGPVLSTGPYDPTYVTTPFVRHIGNGFEMWYCGVTGWSNETGRSEATYATRRAVSEDGFIWSVATTAFDSAAPSGTSETRPWILAAGERQWLWLSRRGSAFRDCGSDAYRIVVLSLGPDGGPLGAPEEIAFVENPAPGDWDDRMQAYACVVPWNGGLAMFYNGNDFGRGGFGWASSVT